MGVTMSDLSERLKELGSGLGGFCAGEALPKTGGSHKWVAHRGLTAPMGRALRP